MHLSKKLAAALVVVAAIAAGSAAFGAIPGPRGEIQGCYDKQSGQLRVTDPETNKPHACTAKESALNWNEQGPPGERGPSDAYQAMGDGFVDVGVSFTGLGYQVQTLDLEPGNYVLSGFVTALVPQAGSQEAHVACWFDYYGGAASRMDSPFPGASAALKAPINTATMPLLADVDVTTATRIILWCTNTGPDSVKASGSIIATKVAELHP